MALEMIPTIRQLRREYDALETDDELREWIEEHMVGEIVPADVMVVLSTDPRDHTETTYGRALAVAGIPNPLEEEDDYDDDY